MRVRVAVVLLIFMIILSCANPLLTVEEINESGIKLGVKNNSSEQVGEIVNKPKNILVSKGFIDYIKITWESDDEDVVFNLYRSEEVNGSYKEIASKLAVCSYEDRVSNNSDSFDSDTTYFYKVCSINKNEVQGAFSETDSGFFIKDPNLFLPPNLSLARAMERDSIVEVGESVIFGVEDVLNPVTGSSEGLNFTWIYDGKEIETSDSSCELLFENLGVIGVKVIISNVNGSEEFDLGSMDVYPVCPVIENGNFEDAENIAPWVWDIDVRVRTTAFSGSLKWILDVASGSENVLYSYSGGEEAPEQITNLVNGFEGGKAATICNTIADTGNWADVGDKKETSGSLTSVKVSLLAGLTYKVSAKVYKEKEETTVTISFGSSEAYVLEAGWNDINLEYTPEKNEKVSVVFFKGKSNILSDSYEVKFDNVTLGYKK